MAETIAVLSLKGGTGKTTTVRTLTDVFREIGLDVLAIDMDPQGNLSDYFNVPGDATPTVADVLAGDAKLAKAVHGGVVPATPILAEVERGLSGRMGRELVLRKALKDARKTYDIILVDCPPALGLLTINGLVAADWALISSEAQYFAMQGVQGALEVIGQAKEYYNDDLEWLGVAMNIADMRTKHSRDAYEGLKQHFGDKVFQTVIRSSIAYAESAEKAESILTYRPDLGADYARLADEVLDRVGLEGWRRKLEPLLAGGGVKRLLLLAALPVAGCGAAPEGAITAPPVAIERESAPVAAEVAPPPLPEGSTARLTRSTTLRASPGGRKVATLRTRTGFGGPTVLAVVKRRGDWLAVRAAELPNGKLGWIRARAATLGSVTTRITVDRSARRLTLRRDGEVVRRVTVAVGRPGHETPLGRYGVTDVLLMPAGTPYGCCAIALSGHQESLPAGWTGGDRLAIHGTTQPATIGTAASLGCLRASDTDIRALLEEVPLGTPVTVVE